MRVKVDMESDALCVRLSEEEIVESVEATSDMIFDYDKDGRVVGIEILNIKDQFSTKELADQIASKSELTEDDVEEMSEELKKRIAEHYS